MAEKRNPGLGELNEAIAREHGVDPSTLKNYRLPETGTSTPEVRGPVRELPVLQEVAALPGVEEDPEILLGGIYAGMTRKEAAERRSEGRQAPVAVPAKVTQFASKSDSCFAWTPRQMLEQMIEAIDQGLESPSGMVVVFTEEQPDKRVRVRSWRSQLEWTEEYTYLQIAQQNCIDQKRSG